MLISEDRPDENKLPIVARFAGSCLLQRKCVERGDRHVLGLVLHRLLKIISEGWTPRSMASALFKKPRVQSSVLQNR